MQGVKSVLARRGLLVVAATLLLSAALASAASAASYTVNDTRDLAQSSTAAPGSCVSTASTCTLRAAVQAANQNGGASTINLPAGTYPIDTGTSASSAPTVAGKHVDNTVGEFKINPGNNSTQVTVIGAGAGSTVINAQGHDRVFDVFANGALDIQKMTLENASPDAASFVAFSGGAIYSDGHLSAESVVFTGNTAPGNSGGGIYASSNSGSTLLVTGCVFQNNTAGSGAAIEVDTPNDATISFTLLQGNNTSGNGGAVEGFESGGLTLNFDDLVQNTAFDGGGAVNWQGDGALNITNSLFTQNQAGNSDGGGAIWSNGSTSSNVNVSSASFDGNTTSGSGGALLDEESNALTLSQDRFSANSATATGGGGGGALYLNSAATSPVTSVVSSEFDGNTAPNTDGGAIAWELGSLSLLGDSFVLNSGEFGGALYRDNGQLLTIVNTTMSRNTATGAGGAIAENNGQAVTWTNDTIAFNNAPAGQGAGIDGVVSAGGSPTTGFGVENTTIAENSGGDCAFPLPVSKSADLGNNNDSDQSCFGGAGGPNDLVGVNPLLGEPANNGGPSAGGPGDTETLQTDAEPSNSPIVDAGNNTGCPDVDERGVTRPQGKACDIGAFELGFCLCGTTTSTATTGLVSTSQTTVTSTTTTHKTTRRSRRHRCRKGKHRSHGKCVKNHHKKRHHTKHRR